MDIVLVIAFVLGFNVQGLEDELMVQFRGMPHVFEEIDLCKETLATYTPEYVVEEFINTLPLTETDKVWVNEGPGCYEYNRETGQYPQFPQFDVPLDLPNEGESVEYFDRKGEWLVGVK